MTCGGGTKEYLAFSEIYSQMRKRKSFETTVDDEEFGRIQEALTESQRMRVLICLDESVPVAGLVATTMGNSAIYLLGATSDAGLNAKGAYLLQWELICWLKKCGITSYDLGGIDPEGNPGVYHFKSGLSGLDICQISPFALSDSAVSSGMVKVALAIQRAFRASLHTQNLVRAIRQPVIRR